MSATRVGHSTRPVRIVAGLIAALCVSLAASAAEQPYKPFKWDPPTSSAPVPPTQPASGNVLESGTVIEGDALSELDLKWSFIDFVNGVANSKPEEAASRISSVLDVDRATAMQLIDFSADAISRLQKSTSDTVRGLCDSLRAAKTEQAFVTAFDAQSLQADRMRAEIAGDLDSAFAGATAAKIHKWIETQLRPSEHQIKPDLHRMFATPEARRGVLDRACGAANPSSKPTAGRDMSGDLPNDAPPYGLSCSACQREPGMICGTMARMPLAAIVERAQAASHHEQCTSEDLEQGSRSKCTDYVTWHFGDVRLLRGPAVHVVPAVLIAENALN